MTFISKVIKYVIATQKKLCYSLDIVRGMDGMKKEERGILEKKPRDASADAKKIKQLEKDLKKAEKQIKEERDKVEILKKCLQIFMQQNE